MWKPKLTLIKWEVQKNGVNDPHPQLVKSLPQIKFNLKDSILLPFKLIKMELNLINNVSNKFVLHQQNVLTMCRHMRPVQTLSLR